MPNLCRKGLHDVSLPAGRMSNGSHLTCRACREASRRDVQSRYEGTMKGHLTNLRYHSGGAAARLEAIEAGLD